MSDQLARMWGRNSKNQGRLCGQPTDGNRFPRALEGAGVKTACCHCPSVARVHVYSDGKGACANFVT